MAFVVDASVTLAWHFRDEANPLANAILERTIVEAIVVPTHWALEVANGVVMGERRGRASQDQAARLMQRLDAIDIEVDDIGHESVMTFIMPLARAHRLTVYDALYLELAERRGLPLATFDGALAAAARSVGVRVLEGEV